MRNNINSGRLRTPYMSLQDHELSKIILVLPETTPMREAASTRRFKQSRHKTTLGLLTKVFLCIQELVTLLKSR
jgi:hypothetical protein